MEGKVTCMYTDSSSLLSQDADMFWDFITLRPESTHQVSFLFSDRGIPDGYHHLNGYGSHTFKLVNRNGDSEEVYCKFHYKVSHVSGPLPLTRRRGYNYSKYVANCCLCLSQEERDYVSAMWGV